MLVADGTMAVFVWSRKYGPLPVIGLRLILAPTSPVESVGLPLEPGMTATTVTDPLFAISMETGVIEGTVLLAIRSGLPAPLSPSMSVFGVAIAVRTGTYPSLRKVRAISDTAGRPEMVNMPLASVVTQGMAVFW